MQPTENQLPLLGLDWLQYYSVDNVYHPGVDMGLSGYNDYGQEVKAVHRGIVEYVHDRLSTSNGFGRFVILKHPDGNYTRYAHLKDIKVKQGEEINSGAILGHLGGSGRTEYQYSPHLHCEVFGEDMAEMQRSHDHPWRFYPIGKSKSWVEKYYVNPWEYFDDIPVSEWAEDELKFLQKEHITNGDRPHDHATRQEVWVMLFRAMKANRRYLNSQLAEFQQWK